MIHIIWEYEVDSSQVRTFEEIYGSNGDWVSLFKQSQNYHGTVLLKDHSKPGRYLTIDQWNTIDDFESFKAKYIDTYNKLDHKYDALTLVEKKIGVFEVA